MTVTTLRTLDVRQPPAGKRLELAVIAAELGVSMRSIADAAGTSPTSMYRISNENLWPQKRDQAEIRLAIRALFKARGASDEQLTSLFFAHVKKRSAAQRHGIAPAPAPAPDDYQAPVDGEPAVDAINPADRNFAEGQNPKVTDVLLPKQTLTREAKTAFKLLADPFSGEVIEDSQMFNSADIAYIREACLQVAKSGGFVAVVGESGAGKTTIQADLESRIARDKLQVVVIKPWVLGMEDSDRRGKTLKSTDILASVINTLDPLATLPQSLQARSNKASKLLEQSAEAGFLHMLVIEEAHSLPDATLKHLKRLNEMKLGRRPLLGILLLGQTELKHKLDPKKANLREVTQRCEVLQLLPLDGELKAYLAHRAKACGRVLSEFIDDKGIEALRSRLTVTLPGAGGAKRAVSLLYPLAVNNLMTAALNAAAGVGAPSVNDAVVMSV